MEQELDMLDYCVEQVVFKNEDTGFAVVQGIVDNLLITAVGELASVEEGEQLKLIGHFVQHPSYGKQFKVQAFERKLPETARAIRKFLASGAIRGIGPVLADRIVETFGDDTFSVIENDPSCLERVKGISPKKVKQLSDEFCKLFAMRRLMIFLEGFGIKSTDSVKAWALWGPFALETIQKNPYRLCQTEIGISFSVADQIAQKLEFAPNDSARIACGIEYILRHNAKENGHTCVPRNSLIPIACGLLNVQEQEVDKQVDNMIEQGRLCLETIGKEFLFLPSFWIAEQYIAQRVHLLLNGESIQEDTLDALITLEEERMGLEFAPLQRKAIRDAVTNGIFVLTGGPGTGKTTILNAVISILEQRGCKIAICAPTGRAAKRLSEVSGRDAVTVHRLLGVQTREEGKREFVHNQHNLLKYDVIIIDEMSMVDSLLFYDLLQAAKPECRFILSGDRNQLPSVSAGNVLREMIVSDCVPCIELKDIFRQSAQSLIITNAHAIIHGELPDLSQTDNDFFFLNRNSPKQVEQTIVQLCALRLPSAYQISAIDDIQVVCPSRKGLVGTVNLNNELQKKLNPPSKSKEEYCCGAYIFREGDKVMQVRNNYDIVWKDGQEEGTGIFNGDIGIIKKIYKNGGVMEIDFDGRMAAYSLEMAKELELAYAITIHKSQGNEFQAVVMPVFCSASEFYNRNLLYTGITRACRLLVLVGSAQSIRSMTNQVRVNFRYTGLKEFMKRKIMEGDV